MQIEERQSGNVMILDLAGKLTIGEGDELLKDKINSVLHQGHRNLLLNLAEVPYVDSAGLGQMVSTLHTVNRQGGKLKLLNLTQRIEESPFHHEAADRVRRLRQRARGARQLLLIGECPPRPASFTLARPWPHAPAPRHRMLLRHGTWRPQTIRSFFAPVR